jgi:hypothetical protein
MMESKRSKGGRSMTELGRAQAAKERALGARRLLQLREKKDWKRVIDAGMAAALAVIRDRLTAIPDRVPSLMPEQRKLVLAEIHEALEAWSRAEVRFVRSGQNSDPLQWWIKPDWFTRTERGN